MKKKITLVIGGCRSGKSSHALGLADAIPGNRKIFIATSVPTDPEMENRVTRHRQERGDLWTTVEEPLEIADTIDRLSNSSDVILVDCLTLWTSNLMFNNLEQPAIELSLQRLASSLDRSHCPVIVVSNEVGTGIVPENALARQFRDMAGFVNQQIAAVAHGVVWMVAGIPVKIKS
ncbi:MAG: bifunctional adenosylcobinamide kinase/adenosylcobinamide-phosphate guanylyltransferase [Desulfobacterium sp.]|jgi:adenosylcobinamide kinase/adenosylcobinamide-phosphate guanylyltransferase|nr:bifunctional adenosylcobinamide kinase/adenosylcobinamide-phosphate guanylyltransferase [Desulfobacterium sp.]